MLLPGGLVCDGVINQHFSFKPVTGLLELSLSEQFLDVSNHSARISLVLTEALNSLAGEAVNLNMVKSLSVGDRQYLMRKLSAHIDDSPLWLTVKCKDCAELFDLSIKHSELPVKPAGQNFPETIIETSQGKIKVRVPTGEDQEKISAIKDDQESLRTLIAALTNVVSDNKNEIEYSAETLNKIEQTVEDMAPEIATEILAKCPHCQLQNIISMSPYTLLDRHVGSLYNEIHRLATHYHWSENDILSLPRNRRLTYLNLIDQSREMYNTSNQFEAC